MIKIRQGIIVNVKHYINNQEVFYKTMINIIKHPSFKSYKR